jgi:Mycoplasma protein of unknown function, DUF285
MANMFSDATAFNQPLASWSTSLVTRMDSMFARAKAFNQSLVSPGGLPLVNTARIRSPS